MNIIAVINGAAGGIRPDSEDRLRQVVRSAGPYSLEIVEFDRTSSGSQLRYLASRNPDFLVVWGGDGTHRSALNAIGRKPSNLVLLPGGTRNLLAKSLHGPEAWDRILPAILAVPLQCTIPAGLIGDDLFFCAMLAGAPALFAEARESLRDGDIGGALNDVGEALDAVQNLHLAAYFGDAPGGPLARLPPTSIVGALIGYLAGNRRMEVVILDSPSMFLALDVIWSSFQTGFRDREGVSIIPAEALKVENEGDESIPIIVDGELLTAGSSFDVGFVERGAYCLIAN